MKRVYYNDNDKYSAAWLRELVKAGLIAYGDVDDRNIEDVTGDDIKGYKQVHLFAGIGGWSYALRLAGWPDDKQVWTGSCPCQPLSQAGHGRAEDDPRHLWPHFRRLIEECRPSVVFGEQVASKLGRGWLAGVFSDLEALEYACAGADLCAASIGAPHIRQRLYWVAKSKSERWGRWMHGYCACQTPRTTSEVKTSGSIGISRMGNPPDGQGIIRECGDMDSETRTRRSSYNASRIASTDDWSDFNIIPCRDGKARRVESGVSPLVDGFPERVGLLRGYGNSIVSQVAASFVRAFMECVDAAIPNNTTPAEQMPAATATASGDSNERGCKNESIQR